MHRILVSIAAALAAAGCHTFQPASVGDLTPGESVRVRITGAFSDSLQATLPGEPVRELEGVVASDNGSSFYLDVPVQQELRGMRFETLNQRVQLPVSAVVEVETKRLDKGRTIIAAGAAVTVVGAVVALQLSKDGGGGTLPGGPGGPDDAIVSVDLLRATAGALGWLLGR